MSSWLWPGMWPGRAIAMHRGSHARRGALPQMRPSSAPPLTPLLPQASQPEATCSPPHPHLPCLRGVKSSVRRVELSFDNPQWQNNGRMLADVQAPLIDTLSSMQLGSVAPLHNPNTAAPGSAGGQPGTPTAARTVALSLQGYQATTKAIEDVLQQSGVLGAWPEVEVRPVALRLDGHLSEHLVVADVVYGLVPGYLPQHGQGPASAYPRLLDLDLTLPSWPVEDEAEQLLNPHMLPSLQHLQLGGADDHLHLAMSALDLPGLHSLVLITPTSFNETIDEYENSTSAYCGLTRLTQLTRLVYTTCDHGDSMRNISMLEPLPSLNELELKQVPLDAPFGKLTSLTRLSTSFSTMTGGSLATWDVVGMVGHLTALHFLTLDGYDCLPGPMFPEGALPSLTELCFEGLYMLRTGNRQGTSSMPWDSMAQALPLLISRFMDRCAPARHDSLRKVRFSPLLILSQEPEERRIVMAGGGAWVVKKLRPLKADPWDVRYNPSSLVHKWDVEFEAMDVAADAI